MENIEEIFNEILMYDVNEALKYRKDNIYMDSLENAIQKCKKQKESVIFIVGSFYTYKEVMQYIKNGL